MSADAIPEWARELRSDLDAKLGFILESVSPEQARGRAPVAGNTQPYGAWHGGATGVLCETLASVAAAAHARTRGARAVGTELNCTHHASVRSGWVHGTATALRLGGNLASYAVELRDDDDRLIASGRVTCFLLAGDER